MPVGKPSHSRELIVHGQAIEMGRRAFDSWDSSPSVDQASAAEGPCSLAGSRALPVSVLLARVKKRSPADTVSRDINSWLDQRYLLAVSHGPLGEMLPRERVWVAIVNGNKWPALLHWNFP